MALDFDMSICAPVDLAQVLPVFNIKLVRTFLLLTKPTYEQEEKNLDNSLLRRIAAGDRAAFAEFYDRHSTLMFSVAVKILHDLTEAEDILQEAFVEIWTKAGKYDPKLGKATSWVAILVRNRAVDKIRASERRKRLGQAAGTESSILSESHDAVNETIQGQEKAKLIQSVVRELPMEQRQAIELAYFSGLTQNEISERLHEPLGTIKARIRRGMLKLRDQLEGLL
jgi:RNA polymerase sigma-70 factor, ECF subfamily